MNANELADDLLKNGGNCSWFKEIATMLRQQQAEIEALKGGFFDWSGFKKLTDEEILEIANQCLVGATAWHNPDLDPIEFARAILRKAQEK